MTEKELENLNLAKAANDDTLAFFNRQYIKDLEEFQRLKTDLFEIDIKIEELEKTRSFYEFKSTSKKQVFSPNQTPNPEGKEQRKIIDDNIRELDIERDKLHVEMATMHTRIEQEKSRLAKLEKADRAFRAIFDEEYERQGVTSEKNTDNLDSNMDEDDFEFLEEKSETPEIDHGYNILMQDAFDKTYLSTIIDKNIKTPINTLNYKLDTLSKFVTTDASRAKLSLYDIMDYAKKIVGNIDEVERHLDTRFESNRSIIAIIEDYIEITKDFHNELTIESSVEYTDYDTELHPVYTINLMKLLEIFFNNIFDHSGANRVDFKINVSENMVTCKIFDNGVGINDDYLDESPWYSSLHKAYEILYLLGGSLSISKGEPMGTKIAFNFPISK